LLHFNKQCCAYIHHRRDEHFYIKNTFTIYDISNAEEEHYLQTALIAIPVFIVIILV